MKILLPLSNILHKNKNGNTALHKAAKNGHVKILEEFHNAKSNMKLTGKNRMTPLHFAAMNNKLECVK